MASGDLTYKQRLFVEAYLGKANGNATEAARMAGYASPTLQGHENIRKPNIRVAIDAKLAGAAMSATEVLARTSAIAAGDLDDFIKFDKKGNPSLDLVKARKAGRLGLVRSLKPTRWGWSIELHSVQDALNQLGKYHGLWDGDKMAGPADHAKRLPAPTEVEDERPAPGDPGQHPPE